MNGRLQEDQLSLGASFFLRRNCREICNSPETCYCNSPWQLHCILPEAMVWDSATEEGLLFQSPLRISPVMPTCGAILLSIYLKEFRARKFRMWSNSQHLVTFLTVKSSCCAAHGSSLVLCDDLDEMGWRRGEVQGRGYMYICIIMADSHCCIAETNRNIVKEKKKF